MKNKMKMNIQDQVQIMPEKPVKNFHNLRHQNKRKNPTKN